MPTTLKKKLNILFVGSYYPPYTIGGAEKMFQIHAEGFAKRGHQVSAATLGPNRCIIRESPTNSVQVFRCPTRNLYWPLGKKPGVLGRIIWHVLDCYNPRHDQDLENIVANQQPDIIICEGLVGWSASVWKFFAKRHIPIVQIVHDSSYLCAKGTMFRHGRNCGYACFRCKLMTTGYRVCNQYVSHYVFVSQSQLKRFGLAKFTQQTCSVVYNAEPIAIEPRSTIWHGERPLHIGMLATLSEGKGVFALIRAFKLLNGDFTLSIGGKPVSSALEQKIHEEIQDDPRIHLTGWIDAEDFFRKIDLAIVPSIVHESFGLVAVEACAKGIPAIVADRGGLTEIVQNGINGLYCNPEQPHSIAHAIQRLYNDKELYGHLASNATHSVSQFANVNTMISKLEKICYSVIGG